MSIEDRIKEIIVEIFSVEPGNVVPNAAFVDDLGLDSLDLAELQMWLGEKFDIQIDDDEMDKLHTVQDAIEYIEYMGKNLDIKE